MADMLDRTDRSMTGATESGQGSSKVDRYGWSQPGEPGEFRWIDKNHLKIDDQYQRSEVSPAKVMKIAREWDWMLLNAISVAERRDHSLWVYDGGHRVRAAFRRSDILALPCMVFGCSTVQREAGAFVRSATMRTSIKPRERLLAQITEGDPLAIRCADLLRSTGYAHTLTTRHRDFHAFATLLRCLRNDINSAEQVFRLCAEIAGLERKRIPKKVLAGLFYLASRLSPECGVFAAHNRQKLIESGMVRLEAAIHEREAVTGRGGEKVAAFAIIDFLNKGRRTRHIKLL